MGLPALMGNASGPLTNATDAATAEMGAMKIHPSVAEDVPKTQQDNLPDLDFLIFYFISKTSLISNLLIRQYETFKIKHC